MFLQEGRRKGKTIAFRLEVLEFVKTCRDFRRDVLKFTGKYRTQMGSVDLRLEE